MLNIASNKLTTLPSDLSFLRTLEEVNFSSNEWSSDSVLVNPNKLFAAMATIPNLKKLNLSRNKFKAFHADDFLLKTSIKSHLINSSLIYKN